MFHNYLTIAIRNLLLHKGYSLINIFGLSVGIACCILVLSYVHHEFQHDTFHKDGDRIYRVISEIRTKNKKPDVYIGTSGPLGPAIADALPEIESQIRVYLDLYTVWFRTKKHIGIQKYCVADPHFFEFFSFPLLQGDAKTALKDPFTAVISKSMARRYFDDENPIGQIITVESRDYAGDYRVTGIMKNIPVQSTLKMDFVTATTQAGSTEWAWNTWHEMESWHPIWTFIKVRNGISTTDLESQLPNLMLKSNDTQTDVQKIREANPTFRYFLQPISRMRLYSNADYGVPLNRLHTDISRIHFLSAIALFVLAIACMNFMNLTTARSTGRAREVGLRKVVGAHRHKLIQQFLSESILTALLSLILAFPLAMLALPTFNELVDKSLSLNGQSLGFVALLAGTVCVGLLAGSYPAFYLSAFQPIAVLKGTLQSNKQGSFIRKGLVITQFSISILLIIGTVVVYRQLAFMQNKDVGFEKEHTVTLPIFRLQSLTVNRRQDLLVYRHETVKQAFLAHPNIEAATIFRQTLGKNPGRSRLIKPEGFENAIRFPLFPADENLIDFFGLELVAGRIFKPEEMFRDHAYYILNESAVKSFGWTDPIGKEIQRENVTGTVIGVVKDFHNGPFRRKIQPGAFIPMNRHVHHLVLRIQTDRFPETVDFLKETWNQFLPNRPFRFGFLDEDLNRSYAAEQRIAQSMGTFAIIAIGLACLGLFGLAAFTAEQRTKEIGVRKVLGASTKQIVFLLSKEFAQLVLIANLIAWPIAYFALNQWLQEFAYRTTLEIDVFILGGGLTVLIAMLTISTLSIRASLTNPIESLRYE